MGFGAAVYLNFGKLPVPFGLSFGFHLIKVKMVAFGLQILTGALDIGTRKADCDNERFAIIEKFKHPYNGFAGDRWIGFTRVFRHVEQDAAKNRF